MDTPNARAVPNLLVWALLLLPSWLFAGSGHRPKAQVIRTSVCNLYAHPEAFNKRVVRVHAHIYMGIEGSGLNDDSCKHGVALWIANAVRTDPDMKALDEANSAPPTLGTAWKEVTATVTGVFLWRRRGHPPRVLDAIKITHLKIKALKTPWER